MTSRFFFQCRLLIVFRSQQLGALLPQLMYMKLRVKDAEGVVVATD